MHELIEVIRAAVVEGATAEAKQAGAQACRTILAALEAEPGQPMAPPVPPATPPNPFAALAGLNLDRALDLVIARLRSAVGDNEQPASPAFRVELVRAPRREGK